MEHIVNCKRVKRFLLVGVVVFGFSVNSIIAQRVSVGFGAPTLSMVHRSSGVKSIIDTANWVVVYTYSFFMDTIKDQMWRDRYVLEVGSNYSCYYSQYADKADSVIFLFRNSKQGKKVDAGINPTSFLKSGEEEHHDIYIFDHKTDSIHVSNIVINKIYDFREPIPAFDWKIHTDTMQILGYTCQLATTHFRGRNYKAWFTFEIPISQGPWKLSGLPGLILKAQTEDRLFDFHAIGIEVPKKIYPIYRHRYAGFPIARQDMLKLYRMTYEDPVGLVLQHGFEFRRTDSQGVYRSFQPGEITWPYVPFLELE